MNNKKPLLAYFGHHKCATTWVTAILHPICHDLNLKFANVHNAGMFKNKLDEFVRENEIDFLAYTNADIHFLADMDGFLGFHAIRDPRDIVVSGYFSHLYSHPTEGWPGLVEHREKLRNASQEEGLFLEIEFNKWEFECLYHWNYLQENVLEIKMEELIASPYETMAKALSHLKMVEENLSLKRRLIYLVSAVINTAHFKTKGLIPFHISGNKIPVDILLGYIFQNRYSKLAKGRKQGEEDVKSHYRKGVAGDWANYFTPEHRRYFKERYNDLLIKLDYEKTPDW